MEDLDIDHIIQQFSGLRVLVIGDVMLDTYVNGRVDRISPEAPVPIVSVQKQEHRLGGAANVAVNIKSLGAMPLLCGLVGDDEPARQISDLLQTQEISADTLVTSTSRRTTVKTRIVSGSQQLLRFDKEDDHETTSEELQSLTQKIEQLLPTCHAIIFEDYDKGCIDRELIGRTIELAKRHDVPTIVDPKARNFRDYRSITLLKPNLKELRQALGMPLDTISEEALSEAAKRLCTDLSFDQLLTTLSDRGVFHWSQENHGIIDAHRRSIADVSGAGDTVVATAGLCTALKLPLPTVAQLANLSGGIVCEEAGVVPIQKERLLAEYKRSTLDYRP